MIMQLTDEELMAYVDGEPGSVTDRIAERQRLGFAPSEALLMADFHRTRDVVRAAFAIDADEPLPVGLAEKILGDGLRSGSANGDRSNVAMMPKRLGAETALSRGNMAIAASLAAAVCLAAWHFTASRPELAGGFAVGPVGAETALASVLESRPAGDPVPLAAARGSEYAHVMVAGTFRDSKSRYCREVELLDGAFAPRLAAVACRAPAGPSWSVEGNAIVAQAAESEGIVPAGAPEADVLSALMKMLGANATLPPEEERELLKGGWR